MARSDAVASIPQDYDALLVPRIFEPWAEILLDHTNITAGMHVLDVATGSGPAARCAARRVGPTGQVTAADIAEPMLQVARAKPQAENSAPIVYVQSPAAPLRVVSQHFDLVICQQSLQFFPDRLAALREMKRALRPGGQLAVAVWTELADNDWFTAIDRALLATLGAEAAAVNRAPFRWPKAEELKATIETVGFSDVRLYRKEGTLTFENGIEQAIDALFAMPVAPILETLPKAKRDAFIYRLRTEAQPLLQGVALIGKMASHIAIATA
jgi:ubiquinone/menaquinone biosynthesis C-methylase UbiE